MENTTLTEKPRSSRSLLQSMLRAIVPKDERFFDFLEQQAVIGRSAVRMLGSLATRDLAIVVAGIQECEHEGDAFVRRLEETLASTFVTPLDREDIQKLSSELDDVLDYANSAARSCLMRGVVRPTKPMIEMIELLDLTSEHLVAAVALLRRNDFDSISEHARKVRETESQGDVVYRDAITALYSDASIDAKRVVAEEKVLEALEAALNHAEDLADSLIYLAVKHG